jgi:hypothetical protein
MGLGKQLVVVGAGCFGLAMLVGPFLLMQQIRLEATLDAAERVEEMNRKMAEMDDPDDVRSVWQEDATEVEYVPTGRVEGAYYPDEHVQTSDASSASLLAYGLAGAGGLLVFGIAGVGAYTVLSMRDDEEGDAIHIADDSLVSSTAPPPTPPEEYDAYADDGAYADDAYEDGYDDGYDDYTDDGHPAV